MSTTNRSARPLSLMQAADASPVLARLAEIAAESAARLQAVAFMIPEPLRPAVKPGPVDGASWCLLVEGNAAAAKLRQLLPAMQAHLRSRGWEVNAIRLKVQITRKR